MKAPQYREYLHHVRTERGVSTYQVRRGAGADAEVVATVVVNQTASGPSAHCLDCLSADCPHARRVLERAKGE